MNHWKVTKELFVVLFIFLVSGCAESKKDALVWPIPPDQPRIKFVKTIQKDTDLFGSSKMDVLVGEALEGGFKKPAGVFFKDERLYVTDTALVVVHVFDLKNKKKFLIGGLSSPTGVSADSQGKIYVADTKLDRVMVYDDKGEFIFPIGTPKELKQPAAVALSEKLGRIYVVDAHNHNVAVYSLKNRKRLFEFGGRGGEQGQFNFPSNIVIKDDKLWVVDTINGRIQSFDLDGNFIDSFGRLGDAPGSFSRPKGIAIDSDGNIYVVDSAFNNVQIFNTEGRILMGFGGFGESDGAMILPSGIAIDDNNQIYVADQWNARVSVYQFLNDKYWEKNPEEKKELFKKVDETDYSEKK